MLMALMMLWRGQQLTLRWRAFYLVMDVITLNLLIAAYGAASNPFNAVLLVPVALACMYLPLGAATVIITLSILIQLAQLQLMPQLATMNTAMKHHFFAMVISFIITSLLISAVIGYFRKQLMTQEQALRQLRERQLRDEQLLAIGTAAAQLTHELATPIQSIRLLVEEGLEQSPKPLWVEELEQEFTRIEWQLNSWRQVADDVRSQRRYRYPLDELWRAMRRLLLLTRPEAQIVWLNQHDHGQPAWTVKADRTLLPALTSIIINACEAAAQTTDHRVAVCSCILDTYWSLRIINHAQSMPAERWEKLGSQLLTSAHGLGVGAVISNATIEKFAGQVNWQSFNDSVITTVCLPAHQEAST